jgi:hypothetical protein
MSDEAIRNAIKKIGGSPRPFIQVGAVQSVDWAKRTCVVKLPNGLEFENVRLRAVANEKKEGVCLKPKKDSQVTIAEVDGRETQLEVIGYTEVDAIEVLMQDIELTIEDGKVKLKAKEIIINDGDNKGVPILDKVKANFDAIKKYLDIEKQAISAGIKAVGISTAASGTLGATAFDGAMASNSITFQNMENTKVKH